MDSNTDKCAKRHGIENGKQKKKQSKKKRNGWQIRRFTLLYKWYLHKETNAHFCHDIRCMFCFKHFTNNFKIHKSVTHSLYILKTRWVGLGVGK